MQATQFFIEKLLWKVCGLDVAYGWSFKVQCACTVDAVLELKAI